MLQGYPAVGRCSPKNDIAMMSTARTAAVGQLVFVVIAYAGLTWAFLHNDFSVAYVANHSQLSLPTLYKVAAVWGGHEGSVLLWILLLALAGQWLLGITVAAFLIHSSRVSSACLVYCRPASYSVRTV